MKDTYEVLKFEVEKQEDGIAIHYHGTNILFGVGNIVDASVKELIRNDVQQRDKIEGTLALLVEEPKLMDVCDERMEDSLATGATLRARDYLKSAELKTYGFGDMEGGREDIEEAMQYLRIPDALEISTPEIKKTQDRLQVIEMAHERFSIMAAYKEKAEMEAME